MTSDIQIRPYQPDDVDSFCEAVLESKAELIPWMAWCHENYARQDAETWVAGRPGAWERYEEKSFVIVDSQGTILGSCGIHRIDLQNAVGELGYWVRSSATRRGVATEAVRQTCEWAFRHGDFQRIEILAAVGNLPSQRVAEKAGAIREGILNSRLLLHGRRHDGILYAILNVPA